MYPQTLHYWLSPPRLPPMCGEQSTLCAPVSESLHVHEKRKISGKLSENTLPKLIFIPHNLLISCRFTKKIWIPPCACPICVVGNRAYSIPHNMYGRQSSKIKGFRHFCPKRRNVFAPLHDSSRTQRRKVWWSMERISAARRAEISPRAHVSLSS